jgi:HK97 gp10 family phage protein
MRAAFKGKLGGRLRGEIYTIKASAEGRVIKAMVVSPTEYAKYQEFGTRHHPAHPFLRPAAEESSGQVVKAVRTSISPALAAGVPGRGRIVKRFALKAGG